MGGVVEGCGGCLVGVWKLLGFKIESSLLGKMVCSSLRWESFWYPVFMWNLSMGLRCGRFLWWCSIEWRRVWGRKGVLLLGGVVKSWRMMGYFCGRRVGVLFSVGKIVHQSVLHRPCYIRDKWVCIPLTMRICRGLVFLAWVDSVWCFFLFGMQSGCWSVWICWLWSVSLSPHMWTWAISVSIVSSVFVSCVWFVLRLANLSIYSNLKVHSFKMWY
jgi:hypothetical protein